MGSTNTAAPPSCCTFPIVYLQSFHINLLLCIAELVICAACNVSFRLYSFAQLCGLFISFLSFPLFGFFFFCSSRGSLIGSIQQSEPACLHSLMKAIHQASQEMDESAVFKVWLKIGEQLGRSADACCLWQDRMRTGRGSCWRPCCLSSEMHGTCTRHVRQANMEIKGQKNRKFQSEKLWLFFLEQRDWVSSDAVLDPTRGYYEGLKCFMHLFLTALTILLCSENKQLLHWSACWCPLQDGGNHSCPASSESVLEPRISFLHWVFRLLLLLTLPFGIQ